MSATSDTVARLRLSQIAACAHDAIVTVGAPNAFEAHLVQPQPVNGVDLERPFAPGLSADLALWSDLAGIRLDGGPVNAAGAKALRRAGVPLRHRAEASVDDPTVERASLELHVHPFGVAAILTADLAWPGGLPLDQVWPAVEALLDAATTTVVAGRTRTAPLGEGADAATASLIEAIGGPAGTTTAWPSHRVVTPVDGMGAGVPAALPVPEGPVHVALHHLSGGGPVLSTLGKSLVPQWNNTDFVFTPATLVYMIDVGTATWQPDRLMAGPGVHPSMGDRHRRTTLLIAHLAASVALIHASSGSPSVFFGEWARLAALRIGRLYGPETPSPADGLAVRWYVERTSARPLIEAVLGKPLVERIPTPTLQ